MIPIKLSPAAERQVREASSWYEAQEAGLGARFTEHLKEALLVIQRLPTIPGISF